MSGPETMKIMIVDDHVSVRQGLRVFLEVTPNMECVAEATTGKEAIELFQKHRPDVVLMDLVMPGMNGVEAARNILEIAPNTRIIALTSFDNADLVQDAFKVGITSYVIKNLSIEMLADAIEKAYRGESVISAEIRDRHANA
jgi:two-component system, NarL family, response regulator LiaR